VPLPIAADALGIAERGLERRPVGVAGHAGAGRGGDLPRGVNLADGAAFALADPGVALAVDADGASADDDRVLRRAAVADAVAIHLARAPADAGEGGDDARLQVEAADAPVGHVRDQESALAVQAAVVRLAQ